MWKQSASSIMLTARRDDASVVSIVSVWQVVGDYEIYKKNRSKFSQIRLLLLGFHAFLQ